MDFYNDFSELSGFDIFDIPVDEKNIDSSDTYDSDENSIDTETLIALKLFSISMHISMEDAYGEFKDVLHMI